MKDNKFAVFCILIMMWISLFIGAMFGMKIHPRFEQLITALCVVWFAYWSLSIVKCYKKTSTNETKNKPEDNNSNANTEKTKNSVQN